MMTTISRIALLALVSACASESRSSSSGEERGDATAVVAADTVRFGIADFAALRFVEGSWRGEGGDAGAFYESYRVADDSTIEMTAWQDSTMTTARDSSRYTYRDGVISTSDGGRLVRRDGEGFHFAAPTYQWRFTPESPDQWLARVGGSTTYTMRRVTGR